MNSLYALVCLPKCRTKIIILFRKCGKVQVFEIDSNELKLHSFRSYGNVNLGECFPSLSSVLYFLVSYLIM